MQAIESTSKFKSFLRNFEKLIDLIKRIYKNVSYRFMKSLIFVSFFIILTPYVFSQTKETKYYDNGKVKLEGFVKNNAYDST